MIEPLSRARAALLVVDIQEKLAAVMPQDALAQAVRNTAVLIETARRMWMPIVVSQQYPRGLGPTVAPIEDALRDAPNVHRFDKMVFSACDAPEFKALAPKLGRDQWIVTGMEAHVCVFQSARGLVARGYQVHVASDAITSRTTTNFKIAKKLLADSGTVVSSTEVCVFDLLGSASDVEFKALSRLIK